MPHAIDVIEDYTKRKFNKTDKGYTAELEWTISYCADQASVESIALAQLPVKINATCPFAPALSCTGSGVTEFNYNLSRYRGSYAQLPDILSDDTNPLNQPAFWSWEEGSRSVPLDVDVFGNPIANSAGDAFSNAPHIDRPCFFITFTRNEPFFNTNLLNLINAVNSATWSPMGIPAILPGQAMLRSAKPFGKYSRSPKYLQMVYRFELNPGISQTKSGGNNPSLWDGFLTRVRDQGTLGWYNDGSNKRGRFVDGTKREVTNILLDGTGLPSNNSFKMIDLQNSTPETPIANPTPLSSQVTRVTNGGSTSLIYQTRITYDFNAFGF